MNFSNSHIFNRLFYCSVDGKRRGKTLKHYKELIAPLLDDAEVLSYKNIHNISNSNNNTMRIIVVG